MSGPEVPAAPLPLDVLLCGDGENIHVRRLAQGLTERGVAVALACFEGRPIPGVPMHRLGRRPPQADWRYPLAIPILARLILRLRPSILHACFVSSYGNMATGAAWLAIKAGWNGGVVQSALGSDLLVAPGRSRAKHLLASLTLRRADLVTHNSASLRTAIDELAPGARIHRFVWGPERALIEGRRSPQSIALSTRRLEPNMRVDLVVSAWRRARQLAPEALNGWRLVVTHVGTDEARVRAAAGSDPTIELVGVLPYEELQRTLLRARVMISSPTSDATSAALMDAFAAGVVPVVNAIPGTLEWVDQEVGEIVARDPDVDELAAAIARAATRQIDPAILRSRVAGIVWEDELPRLIGAYRDVGLPPGQPSALGPPAGAA